MMSSETVKKTAGDRLRATGAWKIARESSCRRPWSRLTDVLTSCGRHAFGHRSQALPGKPNNTAWPDGSSVLCNRRQVGVAGWTYADRVMRADPGDTRDPLGHIERMIEHYRLEKVRRLQRRALTLWRKLEARQALVKLEKPLERVH